MQVDFILARNQIVTALLDALGTALLASHSDLPSLTHTPHGVADM